MSDVCDTVPLHPSPAVHYPNHQSTLQRHQVYSTRIGGSDGAALKNPELLNQIMAMKGCLAAGVSLNALDNPLMKDFLRVGGMRLPSSSHLGQHIPFIVEEGVRSVRATAAILAVCRSLCTYEKLRILHVCCLLCTHEKL